MSAQGKMPLSVCMRRTEGAVIIRRDAWEWVAVTHDENGPLLSMLFSIYCTMCATSCVLHLQIKMLFIQQTQVKGHIQRLCSTTTIERIRGRENYLSVLMEYGVI